MRLRIRIQPALFLSIFVDQHFLYIRHFLFSPSKPLSIGFQLRVNNWFALEFIQVGVHWVVLPGTQRLPRLVGLTKAVEMMLVSHFGTEP
jgi:hypothetical protein